MKQRRTFIVSVVLVCTLLLGVAFAAIATTINLTGYIEFNKNALANNFDLDIELTGTPDYKAYKKDNSLITGLGGNVFSASIDAQDPDVGSITAKHFSEIGEYVVIQYQIINKGNTSTTAQLSIAVDDQTSSTNNNYFTVTKSFAAEKDAASGTATYDLAPGDTCWVTIKMVVATLPTETEQNIGQINWVLTATAVDEGVAA